MTPRRAQLLTAVIGVFILTLAAIVIFVVPADALGPLRWVLGLSFGVAGLLNLAFIPRYSREALPDESAFRPLDAAGHPVVGSAVVKRIAAVLDRELAATPHQVETSPDAVRVSYDSDVFYQPGSGSLRRFRWRTTLIPAGAPNTFVRLDQEWDREQRLDWTEARVTGGLRMSAACRIVIGTDDSVTKTTVSTGPVSSAVRTALKQAGVRQVWPTMALVGLVCVTLGVLVAVGAVIGPLL